MAANKNEKSHPKRSVGRPPSKEGQLALWIKEVNRTREDVARELGVSRRYVDALCREQRVPKAEVIDRIDRLTGGKVKLAYWAAIERARKSSKA